MIIHYAFISYALSEESKKGQHLVKHFHDNMKSPAKACLDNSRNTEVGEVAAISRGAI
jgi:hypothetical protein